MNSTVFWIFIGVAFMAGYSIVSFVIKKLQAKKDATTERVITGEVRSPRESIRDRDVNQISQEYTYRGSQVETVRSRTKIASNIAIIVVLIVVAIVTFNQFGTEKKPEIIFNENKKSVVLITVYDFFGDTVGFGSGFIVDSDGVIATNYHVIKDAAIIEIKTIDDRVLVPEYVKYVDSENDIALIKIKKSKEYKLPTVSIEDSNDVTIGEKVYAIGNPKGLENTFSEGIVSGVREISDGMKVIQITAPVSPGSSGGPIINRKGKVVGIASFIIKDGQNLNFAEPINLLKGKITSNDKAYHFPSKWNDMRHWTNAKRTGVYEIEVRYDSDNILWDKNKKHKMLWIALSSIMNEYAPRFDMSYELEELDCSSRRGKSIWEMSVSYVRTRKGKIVENKVNKQLNGDFKSFDGNDIDGLYSYICSER